jgi:hypothetical protein
MSVYDRSEGTRCLFSAKYAYSGVVRGVEGKSLILDDCWKHFWTDASTRVRDSEDPPVYMGDDVPISLDYIEDCCRNEFLTWAAEEDALSPKKARKP